jgi:hypothetical protein
MRLLILLFVVFQINVDVQAQYRGYNWVVPDSAGINFNTSTPSVFYSNISGTTGSITVNVSSVSNQNGELLFYTNGTHVFDNNNDTMTNGFGLASGFSSANGTVILPYPDHEDSLYLIIHSWLPNFYFTSGVHYSLVNINMRAGLGDIDNTQKNVLIYSNDTVCTPLIAIRHANGRDWWIIQRKAGIKGYIKLLLTPNGISFVGLQSIGTELWSWFSAGEFAVNSSGDQIALSMWDPLGPSNQYEHSTIEVIDFDRCSGELSHPQILSPTVCWSLSYSPNGKYLYYCTYDTFYQVKGLDGSTAITQAPVAVNPFYNDSTEETLESSFTWGYQELGPDGKIYVSMVPYYSPNISYQFENMNLCTIDSPDIEGNGCNFSFNTFNLGGKRSGAGLPNMPNYNLGALEGSPCDTLNTAATIPTKSFPINIYPNPAADFLHYQSDETVLCIIAYDVLGRNYQLQSTSAKPALIQTSRENVSLDIRALPDGLYTIEFITRDKVYAKRFVKESIW